MNPRQRLEVGQFEPLGRAHPALEATEREAVVPAQVRRLGQHLNRTSHVLEVHAGQQEDQHSAAPVGSEVRAVRTVCAMDEMQR